LRRFELALLGHLGYGVDFLHCAGSGEAVDDTMTYRYREEKGFIASVVIDNNTFTGHHLKALASREFPDSDAARRKALYPYRPEALSWRQTAKEPGAFSPVYARAGGASR
jgi:recombinational DNA repair protein (RecF pathway)